MAITKLGAQILGEFEKIGVSGAPGSQPAPRPTIWKKMGERVVGPAMSFAMPALWSFDTANSIASGEKSLGEGLGDLGGSFAGWALGDKAFKSIAQKIKPIPTGGKAGLLRNGLGWGLGMATSFLTSAIGGEAGSSIGNAVLPFKRKPKNVQDYWQTGLNYKPEVY